MEEHKDQNGPPFSTGNTEGQRLANQLISNMLDEIVKHSRDVEIATIIDGMISNAVQKSN
jgi:hypothetical protein